ncbi:MAG TPA: hypothetical protein VGB85_24695 [Nannocystis sp.]
MRSFLGWGLLPLALACAFDPTGSQTTGAGTTSTGMDGVTGSTGPATGTSGVPTTTVAATSTGEPVVTSEPVTTSPTTSTSEPTTGEPGTTGGSTGGSTTEVDTTGAPETTGPPCEPGFYKQVVLVADAVVEAPMVKVMSDMGEGMIAYSPTEGMGIASFTFDLPCADEVAIWGRALDLMPGLNMTNDADSYWVSADDGAETGWFYGCQTLGQPAGYHWLRVTSATLDQTCLAQPWTLSLPAGSHTIHLRNSEAASEQTVATIARLLITNDFNYVPVAPE